MDPKSANIQSRDALASEASDGSAPLGKALRNGFARVVNVEAYGAVSVLYGVTPTPEQYAVNDDAFAAAFQATVVEGGTLHIPPGYWPVNKVVWDASGTVDVQVKAQYATLVVNPALVAGITVAGDPGVFLGNSAAQAGSSPTFLRRVCVEGLNVASAKDPLAGPNAKIGRRGIVLKGIQELEARDVWVSGFSWEGATLDTVWDSSVYGLRVMWCGNSSPTASGTANNHYGVLVTSTISSGGVYDNCNALRFSGLHVEFAPLMLRLDRHARHIHFTDMKLEQGGATTNWSEVSPVQLDDVWEIDFKGGMIVVNSVDMIAGQQPVHVVGSTNTLTADNLNSSEKKNVVFTGTHFTTPKEGAALWFSGSAVTFRDCDFGKTYSTATKSAFELGNASKLLGGSVTFAQAIPANTSVVPRQDFMRLTGAGNIVEDVTLYCADTTVPGVLLRIGAAAVNNRIRLVGFPWGTPPTLWSHDVGATTLGSNRAEVVRDPGTADVVTPGTPDAFGRYSVRADPGTYTDFVGGFIGQCLLLRASGNGVILQNNAGFITGAGADLTLNTGQAVTLQRVPGAWIVT
jgi:hypothetical protein